MKSDYLSPEGIPNKDISQLGMIREIIYLLIAMNLISAVALPLLLENLFFQDYFIAFVPHWIVYGLTIYQFNQNRAKTSALILTCGSFLSQVIVGLLLAGFEIQVVISFMNLILISSFTLGKIAALISSAMSALTTALLFHVYDSKYVLFNVQEEEPALGVFVMVVITITFGGLIVIYLRLLERNDRREQAAMNALKEARDLNLQRAQYSQLLVNLGSQMMQSDTVPQMSNVICMGIRAALKLDGIWVYDSNGTVIASASGHLIDIPDDIQLPEPGFLNAEMAASLGVKLGLVGIDNGAIVAGADVGGVSKALLLATQPVLLGKAELLFVHASLDMLASAIARNLAEQRLLQAQKLDVIDRMSAGIAHDFNNLLTTIIHSAEVIAQKKGGDSFNESISAIQSATESAANMTRKLLTFAQSPRQTVGLIDVKQIIDDIEPVLRQSIEERIVLEIEKPMNSLWIKSDPSDIEQIILNLVLNARDAILETGMILIRVLKEDDNLILLVEDNGYGMPESIQQKMFDPFFTTKESIGGRGLGLTTAMSLIRSLNGLITVKSQPDEGAIFMVQIPLAKNDDMHERAAAAPQSYSGGGGRKVLLVEDDKQVRAIIKEILEQDDFKVIEALDGFSALTALEQINSVDLIITDVVMPRMSGFKLSEKLQQKGVFLPILFISGYAPKEISSPPKSPHAYLTKPFNSKQLLTSISGLIN